VSQDILYLSQLFNQVAGGWLPPVLLTGLLLALLFKPDRVHNWALLRASCWLLAISVVITPALNVFMSFSQGTTMNFRSSLQTMPPFVITSVYSLAPILQGISVICGLLALIPSGIPPQFEPPKHPLEQ
jgi:hypothetical protein